MTQRDIVAVMLDTMRGAGLPMPPPPAALLPEEQVRRVQEWFDAGLTPTPPGNGSVENLISSVEMELQQSEELNSQKFLAIRDSGGLTFVFEATRLTAGAGFTCNVTVRDHQNTIMHQKNFSDRIVPAEGDINWEVFFTYDAP